MPTQSKVTVVLLHAVLDNAGGQICRPLRLPIADVVPGHSRGGSSSQLPAIPILQIGSCRDPGCFHFKISNSPRLLVVNVFPDIPIGKPR